MPPADPTSRSAPDPERVLRVVDQLCRQLHPDQVRVVRLSSHLEWDLGIGSLERAELIRRLESELGQPLPTQPLFAAPRVRDLVAVVAAPEQADQQGSPALRPEPAPLPPFPEHALTLMQAFDHQLQHQPQRVLYFFEEDGRLERSLSPEELYEEAGKMAGSLARLGVGPGHTVALMLPTGLPFVAGFLALLWLGAVPVPLYPPFRADQIEDYLQRQIAILRNADCRLLISFDRAWSVTQLLGLQCPEIQVVSAESLLLGDPPPRHAGQAEELALIQYTSGSTGRPKGVALTHANLLHNIRAFGKAMQVVDEDTCVSWLPLYHDMGLIGCLLGSLYHGIPLVLMGPQHFLARPSRWLRAMSHYRGTISCAPNFAYQLCAHRIADSELEGLDLSPWRIALNGAEAVRPETLEHFSQRFSAFGFRASAHFPAYGLAEASLAVAFTPVGRGAHLDCIDPDLLQREGRAVPLADGQLWVSSGVALEGTDIEIRDPQGRALPDRHQGRLFFRSGSTLREYYRNPQATAEIKDAEGWVDSGDLAYRAESEIYLTGRAKDLIIKAGRNLYPQDVEEAVAELEGVRRGCVAAFAAPDRRGSESFVVAFETRLQARRRNDLEERVRQRVSQVAGVAADHVVALPPGAIPKTPSGKIRRSECARRFAEGSLSHLPGRWQQALTLARQLPWKRSLRGVYTATCLLGLMGTPALLLSRLNGSLALGLLPGAARLTLKLLGLRLRLIGQPSDQPCLVVCNHASMMDPVVLLAAHSQALRFVVAPWVYDHGLLRHGLRAMGHLKASRGKAGAAPELAQHVGQVVRTGGKVLGFPEGGVESAPGLRQFNLGMFQIAAEAGLPVQCVALQGTRQAMPWPQLVPRAGELVVHFGPLLRAEQPDLVGAAALARQARHWIAEHCGEPMLQQRLRREG